jgi:bifunctional non-homologous end joining protein LigD
VALGKRVLKGPEMFQPMLATSSERAPAGDGWAYEPKYDGIRIVAIVAPDAVALMSRNGIDKARQFPEVAAALLALAKKRRRPVVLDGEVVAIDAKGQPGRFEALQGRMHLHFENHVKTATANTPTAFIAFDVLLDGGELLIEERWDARRKHLERVMKSVDRKSARLLRLTDVAFGSPDKLLRDAMNSGWEGILAKARDARYDPGHRVKHWRKIKLEHQQEFVIGGWTDPRASRQHFGALLVGTYDKTGRLRYAGSVGTGFTDKSLAALSKQLKKLRRKTSPFAEFPESLLSSSHFVEPKFVAEVRFNEWTSTGMLRHPAFLGLRDDKKAKAVVREGDTRAKIETKVAPRVDISAGGHPNDGLAKLEFTNHDKVYFPVPRITKGRLLEYYVAIEPWLSPAIKDRPLILKRFPNGINNESFYQQKHPMPVPEGVRVEIVADDGPAERRLIGGNATTLLYTIQLGSISVDPWQSRVQSISEPDFSIIDLDPQAGATFKRVVQVAQWVKEELDELGLHGVPKTSGASGIHIMLPLPRGSTYEISRVLAELVVRRVNEKHPKETTVVRAVRSRPAGSVYLDYLQNIRGKSVASVYAARAETYASVSTPLKWSEVTKDLSPLDFTIDNVVKRVKRVGDLWAEGMKKRNRLPGVVGDAAA